MLIANTREPARHPWPEDCPVQGGDRGEMPRKDEAVALLAACGWPDDDDPFSPPRDCDQPPAGTMTESCVHEHVLQARLCLGHAVEVQLLGPSVCSPCATGPDPHDCPVLTVITWDDPTAPPTIVQDLDPPAEPAETPTENDG